MTAVYAVKNLTLQGEVKMFSKFKKGLFAVFTMISLILNSFASSVTFVYAAENAGNKAYLEYDPKENTYSFVTESGKNLNSEVFETQLLAETTVSETEPSDADTTEPAVTTVPPTEEIITGTVRFTVVTTKPVSPAETVPKYTGRYRNDANSEWNSYLDTYTTTTTTTTTSKKVYDGIDVSRHQGNINWKKVKESGINFVMIRAGYGMEYDQVDANFHVNIRAAQKEGIECGVYWYSYALNEQEALREAKVCYDTIKDYKLSYPVSFDIEDPSQKNLSKTEISKITKTFCDYLESKNYYVSVYSYASMLNDKMNNTVIGKYDIWVAHTGVSKPNFNGSYGMWQYSWKGSISGITGDVDLDYGYKNYPYIIKNGKYSGN